MNETGTVGFELRIRLRSWNEGFGLVVSQFGLEAPNLISRPSHETVVINLDTTLREGFEACLSIETVKSIGRMLKEAPFKDRISAELLLVCGRAFDRQDVGVCGDVLGLCRDLGVDLRLYKYPPSNMGS